MQQFWAWMLKLFSEETDIKYTEYSESNERISSTNTCRLEPSDHLRELGWNKNCSYLHDGVFWTQNKKQHTFLAVAVNNVKFQKYARMESDIIKAMWRMTMIFGEEAISQPSKKMGNGGNSWV